MTISDFRGPYQWLSNFYLAMVEYEGNYYPSTEHAFQATKALSVELRLPFMTVSQQGLIAPTQLVRMMTCAEAKKAGRRLSLRHDWDKVKLDVMHAVLWSKFTLHEDLKKKLLATGDEELIEGNTWGDRYWGVCNGVGENHLGRLLMELRVQLRSPLRVT